MSELFGARFVVLDALLLASFRSSFFDDVFYIFFRCLLGSILSSQADPPILKNLDFAMPGARFLKNQGLGSKDDL